MKKLFVALFLTVSYGLFSQGMIKMLQSGKWYVKGNGKKLIYSKKPSGKEQPTQEFLKNGKMVNCGVTTESSFDATGNEAVINAFRCDSVWTYQVKNNLLQTRLLQQKPDHYRMDVRGETIELTPIKAEDFK